ncbi:MAG: hypothetical protein ACSHX9_09710 [Luteolibacter sp.]
MKTQIIIALVGLLSVPALLAGGINVLHAGPDGVVRFEVSAGEATMDFTLANGENSGSFVLPDEKATIKGYKKGIPDLEIPASKDPRIAVLVPSTEGFKWHLLGAKPSGEKWAFRIVNLSTDTAKALSNSELIEIPAGDEKTLDVSGKAQINLKIPNTINLSYEGGEPTGVVGFVYHENDEWRAIFLPDR